MTRRLLILATLALVALVCGTIARAHFLRSGANASPATTVSTTVGEPQAKIVATGLDPFGMGVSEPASLLLLGAMLLSVAEIRRRLRSSSSGPQFQK
jgi:hypothetical protein